MAREVAGAEGRAGARGSWALRAAGVGIAFTWLNVTLFSKLIHFSTRNSITHLNSVCAFMFLGAAVALTAFVAVRQRQGTGAGGSRWEPRVFASCSAVMSVATVVLVMVDDGLFMQPWCSITSTVAGAATALIFLGWAVALEAEPTRRLPWTMAAALVAGAVLQLVILALPEPAGIAVMAVLPLVDLALLRAALDWRAGAQEAHGGGEGVPRDAARAAGRGDGTSRGAVGGAAEGADCGDRPSRGALEDPALLVRAPRKSFRRALLAIGLLGMAESLACSLFMTLTPSTETIANHWALAIAAAAGALLFSFGASSYGKPGHEWRLSTLSAVELSVLMLAAPLAGGVQLLPDALTLTCHFLVTILAWVVLVRMAREWRVDVRDVFAPGMAASFAGMLAGTMLGSVLVSFASLDGRAMGLLALACALTTMVALLFMLDDRSMQELLNADEERPSSPRRFSLRVSQVSADAGLTVRESQVLRLAAKGRTTRRIQEELEISEGTVNTHLAHIYRKLGVHDRQEMLDLLEK